MYSVASVAGSEHNIPAIPGRCSPEDLRHGREMPAFLLETGLAENLVDSWNLSRRIPLDLVLATLMIAA
jgi:hypothetical protein